MLHLGIFRVVAYDPDTNENARLDYSFSGGGMAGRDGRGGGGRKGGGSRFGINQTSGMIYATREFEEKDPTQFDLQVGSGVTLCKIKKIVC